MSQLALFRCLWKVFARFWAMGAGLWAASRRVSGLLHGAMALALAPLLAIALAVAAIPPVTAQAAPFTSLDLDGLNVPGHYGSITRTVTVGPGTVDSLSFLLNINTYHGHWALEMRINVTAPNGSSWLFGHAGTNIGFAGVFIGPASTNVTVPITPVSTPGEWTFTFSSVWAGGSPAFVFFGGSQILLNGVEGGSPLDLDLSASAVTLTRGQAMGPVTATATGGDGDYGFSVSPALPSGLMLDATSGSISGTPGAVQPATAYTVTVTDGTGATATAVLSITIIEDEIRVSQALTEATEAFMARRAERILAAEPRSWRLDARREAGGTSGFVLRASPDGLDLRFSSASVSPDTLWHVWIEGEYALYTDRTLGAPRQGEFGLISFGGDRLINPRLALGLMAQVDLASESADTATRLSGQGWMVGPYVSAELADGLFFSARGAWGQASNAALVDVYGDGSPLFEGGFTTERWLARATLHGRYDLGRGTPPCPSLISAG